MWYLLKLKSDEFFVAVLVHICAYWRFSAARIFACSHLYMLRPLPWIFIFFDWSEAVQFNCLRETMFRERQPCRRVLVYSALSGWSRVDLMYLPFPSREQWLITAYHSSRGQCARFPHSLARIWTQRKTCGLLVLNFYVVIEWWIYKQSESGLDCQFVVSCCACV